MNDKTKLWIFTGAALVIGVIVGGLGVFAIKGGASAGASASGQINFMPSKFSSSDKNWYVKVDDYVINKADVDKAISLYISQIPAEQQKTYQENAAYLKRQYLDMLVQYYVVILKLQNDKMLGSSEADYILLQSAREALATWALSKAAPKDRSAFIPSQAEINAFYAQNKDKFPAGTPAETIKQQIVQYLGNVKLEQWKTSYMNQIKENFKIQRNNDLLDKDGILNAVPVGQATAGSQQLQIPATR